MQIQEKYWHGTFELGIFIKAFNTLLELASGVLLIFIRPQTLHNILMRLAKGELTEDPKDLFLNYANQYLQHLTTAGKNFAGIYILAHGLLNVFLIIGLWKQKAWTYLVAVGVISSFVLFQLFRISIRPSIFLEVLTVFDLFFIGLTIHEYNYLIKNLTN